MTARELKTVSDITTNSLASQASELAARLEEDIVLARSREEHIRLTARANEAAALAAALKTDRVITSN